MATEAPVKESPSTLNEPLNEAPVEKTPEQMLFPDLKPTEPVKPVAPDSKVVEPKKEEPTSEAKKEEPKTEPTKPSTEVATTPVDYENLKLPPGSPLPAAQLASFKQEAKEQGLTLEEAQGVLEVKNDAARAVITSQNEALIQARQDWKAAWLKDPEYGGDKATESTELAKRAWDRLADSELKTLADQTGFGDHPAVLRMMARLGRMFSEDKVVRGNVGASPKQKSPEEILYGATTPAEEPMS